MKPPTLSPPPRPKTPPSKPTSWRRFRLGVCRDYLPLELCRDRLARGRVRFFEGKELARLKAEEVCDDIAGEGLQCGVEVAHHRVVEAARRLDFVFGVGEFPLKFEKVGVSFKVGITLRNGKKSFERARKNVLRFALCLYS